MGQVNTKRIAVCSKEEALYFTSDVPWACISIATEEGAWPPVDEKHRVGLLRLAFPDLAMPVEGCDLFDEEHAHRILDFVQDVWRRIELLMVHCEAGVSRSPAVAAAVARIHFGEDREFFRPGVYDPNRLVYQALLNVARTRGEYLERRNLRRRRKTGRRRG